jgi:hypothetical protein
LYCWCHIHFEIWIAVLKRRDFLEVIASNGRMNAWSAFVYSECGPVIGSSKDTEEA